MAQPPAPPRQVVGAAIQNLMAARLGRAFVPVALVGLLGVGRAVLGAPPTGHAWVLAAGAAATAVAMLAYGVRAVQRALGRAGRPWMSAALVGGLVPPAWGVYVFGWHGLRALAAGGGTGAVLLAILLAAAGVWVLRSWMRIVEIERLAGVMAMDMDQGGSA